MPYSEALRAYYLGGLETAPAVLNSLLGGLNADDPIWDFQPYPDRFTLREVVAHLADWNGIYVERVDQTKNEDFPTLPNKDEGQIAIDHDYAHSNPVASLNRFMESRKAVVDQANSLDPALWDRKAIREGVGELTIGDLISIVSLHDAYHLRQVVDYQEKYRAAR